MPRAMDRNIIFSQYLKPIGLGLLVINLMGCSELNNFRRPLSPQVGGLKPVRDDPYIAAYSPNDTDTTHPDLKPDFKPNPPTALAVKDVDQPDTDKPSVRSTLHPADSALAVELGPPLSGLDNIPPLTAAASETKPKPNAVQPPKVDAKAVLELSKAKLAQLTSYQVKINRQERVASGLQPPEDVLLSIRRQPKAVRLEWTVGPHKGREVIFAASDPTGMMHVHAGDSILPIPPLRFPPDSPIVMRNSRHPITEAGFDDILSNVEQSLASKDPASKNTYEGIESPEQVGKPCHKLARVTPQGEHWLVYIDQQTLYPTLVEAKDQAGELLELYLFTDVVPNPTELASKSAFDPKSRFGSGGGFLGRLARGTGGDAKTTATPVLR